MPAGGACLFTPSIAGPLLRLPKPLLQPGETLQQQPPLVLPKLSGGMVLVEDPLECCCRSLLNLWSQSKHLPAFGQCQQNLGQLGEGDTGGGTVC